MDEVLVCPPAGLVCVACMCRVTVALWGVAVWPGCGGLGVWLGGSGAAVFFVLAEAFHAVIRLECGLACEFADDVEAGLCEDVRVIASSKEMISELAWGCAEECGNECWEGGEAVVLVRLVSVPLCAWVLRGWVAWG